MGTNNPGVHTPRLYVDGTLKLTSAVSVGALETGGIAIPLEIGRMFRQGWGSPGNYFPGSIDEVRIYDSMPTGSQVTGLYTANTPVRPVSWGSIKGRYR